MEKAEKLNKWDFQIFDYCKTSKQMLLTFHRYR